MPSSVVHARQWPLVAAMVGVVVVATGVVVWGLERQSAAGVERLRHTAMIVARALAREVPPDAALDERLVQQFELDAQTVLLLAERGRIVDLSGRAVSTQALYEALHGATTTVLAREDAVELGLPPRRAVVAQAQLADGRVLMVVSSAAPERQYTRREEWLVGGSMATVAFLAVALGAVALRREGQRLALAHQVERAQLELERDEQLGRAERIAVASALSLGVAHELATPLGVISARVEQLRRGADERAQASLASIAEQVEHMRRVMQGFLSLARGEAPQASRTGSEALARKAARAVLHRYSHAGVRLELALDDALPDISVDEPLFQQALANVLINAAQASAAGSTVLLRVVREGEAVCFEVCDRGAGLDPALISQATRPFVTTRATSGGTGLGLAITTEILRHHSGKLELVARPEGGLIARVIVPIANGGTS